MGISLLNLGEIFKDRSHWDVCRKFRMVGKWCIEQIYHTNLPEYDMVAMLPEKTWVADTVIPRRMPFLVERDDRAVDRGVCSGIWNMAGIQF